MESTPLYWKDSNGNLWSKANYTLGEASAESATLLQCHGCLDSKNLDHCNFCNYCEDCTACHDCTSCIDSAGLAHCIGCSDCMDSTGLCFCHNESDVQGRVCEDGLTHMAEMVKDTATLWSQEKPMGLRTFQSTLCGLFYEDVLPREVPNA